MSSRILVAFGVLSLPSLASSGKILTNNDDNHNDWMSMHFLDQAKEGLRQFSHAKLRTFLALLGVLVGSASVVAMVLGGQLATHQALKEFQSLGTDLLAVSVNTSTADMQAGTKNELSLNDVLALSRLPGVAAVAPYTQQYQALSYQGQPLNGVILGVTNALHDVIHIRLSHGRFITLADQYSFFCVVGQQVYQAMKAISPKDPLGQALQIGQQSFVVVGVADAWAENSFVYANIDSSVLVPLMASTAISQYAAINNIIFRLQPDASIPALENAIQQQLSASVSNKVFTFRSAKELILKMKHQSDIYTALLALIASVSLLVGGIGLMNVQLLIVSERKVEIGVRRALGATTRDILMLFLLESSMLAGLGGVLGVGLGVAIAFSISVVERWDFSWFSGCWIAPVLGLAVSLLVGVLSGSYPAWSASRLRPLDCLRSSA
ncbi:MAG TPA: ABC transporter permease [Gammaproteobacteria bacterium]|nr:ABC transporter permease [Gammaproteobacteria bacterium]